MLPPVLDSGAAPRAGSAAGSRGGRCGESRAVACLGSWRALEYALQDARGCGDGHRHGGAPARGRPHRRQAHARVRSEGLGCDTW